jgi:hypothetical protein
MRGGSPISLSHTSLSHYFQSTMVHYKLDFTVSSPAGSATFLDFSLNGRFLVVGDCDPPSLHILDQLAGFHPTISFITPAEPTALVWETSKAFYVGFEDGRFTHYRINLSERRLVEGTTNNFFRGAFPMTAMALDSESKTLVLSVGPEVFAFRRVHNTSTFLCCLLTNRSSRLTILEASFVLLPTSQTVSTSKKPPEPQLPHSQRQSVSPPTTRLLLHFVAKISREMHWIIYPIFNLAHLLSVPLCSSLTVVHVHALRYRLLECKHIFLIFDHVLTNLMMQRLFRTTATESHHLCKWR